jgi:DNA-binding LacI/PurR family transcriptional regulator
VGFLLKRELKKIPTDKLILFSRLDGFKGGTNYYVQDFYNGTLQALQQGKKEIKKYKDFYLLYDAKDRNFPSEIVNASIDFCRENGLTYNQRDNYKTVHQLQNSVFLVVDDMDLVGLLEQVEFEGLTLGKDTGLISYNDSPLMRVIRQGITTISIDFDKMGKMVADSIIHDKEQQKILETKLIVRESL